MKFKHILIAFGMFAGITFIFSFLIYNVIGMVGVYGFSIASILLFGDLIYQNRKVCEAEGERNG